jgi:hypothetical protein
LAVRLRRPSSTRSGFWTGSATSRPSQRSRYMPG